VVPEANRVQAPPPDATQPRPTSPDVPACHRPSPPSRPWPAFAQPRYTSKRSAAQPNNALAGRASLQDGRPPARAEPGQVWTGCGIPSTPRGLPHGDQGQSYPEAVAGRVEGFPRVAARSGSARMLLCCVKLLDKCGGGGSLPRPCPMVTVRNECVNPAARTVTPAPTTSLSPILRSAKWWSEPVSRCFRVDPLVPDCEAARTTRKGAG
jgi:hypothetical protein